MFSWLDLEQRFRQLAPKLSLYRLDAQWGYAGEDWRISGGNRTQAVEEFERLASIAGKLLIHVSENLTFADTCSPQITWYRALKERSSAFKRGNSATEYDKNNNFAGRVYMGTVCDICNASANLCLSLHSESPPTADPIVDEISAGNEINRQILKRTEEGNQQRRDITNVMAEGNSQTNLYNLFNKRTTIIIIVIAILSVLVGIGGWTKVQPQIDKVISWITGDKKP